MNARRIKIPETKDQWLSNRSMGIGGSDAGAVLGVNDYTSPYTLWCIKTGRIKQDQVNNESVKVGHDLEGYVAKRFTEATGKKVRRSGYSFESIDHPFMLANVDRFVVGENAILECKTANALTKYDYENGEIPASYRAQCVHYMAVTGAEKVYLAVLVMGKGFYWFKIDRDEDEVNELIEAEENFWSMVENNTEPEIDGTDSTKDTIDKLYPEGTEYTADIHGYEDILKKYIETKDKIKSLESDLKTYELQIKSLMKDSSHGLADGFDIKWKTVESNRFDSSSFKKDHPDLADQYTKKSSFRRFEVKNIV